MQLDYAIGLKKEVLATLRREQTVRRASGAKTQSLVEPNLANRIAVGYSAVRKGSYRLEVRVQREGGMAYRRAMDIKDKAKGEANIEIISPIEIPAIAETLAAKALRRLANTARPLHVGVSVGHRDDGVGTLGAFLQIGDDIAILSNSHVLARSGKADIGDWIYQPGREPNRALAAADRIAKLKDSIELLSVDRNESDSAVAVLADGIDHISNVIPAGFGIPDEGKMISYLGNQAGLLQREKAVCKIGRTTGWTEGVLTAIGLDDLTVYGRLGNLLFSNLMEVSWGKRPFSAPGDSGSIVYTRKERGAIGLHFAGGTKGAGKEKRNVSYCCDLGLILNTYKATFLE